MFRMLPEKGDMAADQQDQPCYIQPDQQEDQNGKAGINCVVLGGAFHEYRKYPACGLPGYAGDNAAGECCGKSDARIRHEQIKCRKATADQQVGYEASENV